MVTERVKLTKANIERLPFAASSAGTYIVRDAGLRNFFLIVGVKSKTFVVQRDVRDDAGRRSTERVRLGRWEDGVTAEAARQAAMAALVEIRASAGVPVGMTLREAVALFAASPAARGKRARSAKTDARYAQYPRYLADWMDRPLRSLNREEVRQRHEALTREIAAGRYADGKTRVVDGRATANDTFRWFRAVWNRAMRADESLPVSPTINVNFHPAPDARTAIPPELLPAWYAGVRKVENPVRRDYLLFALFSGMRRESVSEMRWADVNMKEAVLHVPRPKGGEDRAFYLPLSDYLLDLLRERERGNRLLAEQALVPERGKQWVWPAFSASGHIVEPYVEIPGIPYTIHDLRRSFITVAESIDVPLHVIGVLVNHRQPGGSMTARYVRHEVARLRAPMQAITDELRKLIGAGV